MQKKVLADLRELVQAVNPKLEVINIPNFSNTGRLSIQYKDKIGEIGNIGYDFQYDTMSFTLTVNDVKILSQPNRLNYYKFHMKHTDQNDYYKFRNKITIELEREFK